MVLTYTGTKGEPVATPSGAAPTFAADLTEIADWFQTGRAFRKLATQAALIAATGMDDNDIAQVDNIDGAYFKYDGALPGWRMYGIAVFDTAAARTSAITTPADNMLTIRRDADYVEQYLSGAWVRLVPQSGLSRVVPTVSGTGVTVDSTTGLISAAGTGTTISVDGVFTTRRTRIIADLTCTSGTLIMVLRLTGADVTTANYDLEVLQGTTSTAAAAAAAAGASWGINGGAAGTIHDLDIELSKAGVALATSGRAISAVTQNPQTAPGIAIRALSHRLTTAYTGFSIIGTQNLTGTVQVLDY